MSISQFSKSGGFFVQGDQKRSRLIVSSKSTDKRTGFELDITGNASRWPVGTGRQARMPKAGAAFSNMVSVP